SAIDLWASRQRCRTRTVGAVQRIGGSIAVAKIIGIAFFARPVAMRPIEVVMEAISAADCSARLRRIVTVMPRRHRCRGQRVSQGIRRPERRRWSRAADVETENRSAVAQTAPGVAADFPVRPLGVSGDIENQYAGQAGA